MLNINKEILTSFVRQALFLIFGYLGIDGAVTDPASVQTIAAAIVIVLTSVWAAWSRTNKHIVATAATIVPVSDTAQKSVGIADPVKPK